MADGLMSGHGERPARSSAAGRRFGDQGQPAWPLDESEAVRRILAMAEEWRGDDSTITKSAAATRILGILRATGSDRPAP